MYPAILEMLNTIAASLSGSGAVDAVLGGAGTAHVHPTANSMTDPATAPVNTVTSAEAMQQEELKKQSWALQA